MTKARKVDASNGAIAVHELQGQGPAVVLIHGNSCSSRAFSRQLDGALGRRFRLVAIDLPGHGASEDAKDPSSYSLPGHARAVRSVVEALGLGEARFVGWSLGGHIALEMAPDLPKARGFLIFGAPPINSAGVDARGVPAQSGDEIHLSGDARPWRGVRLSRRVLPAGLRRHSAVLSRRHSAHRRAGALRPAPTPRTAATATKSRSCAISRSRSPCCRAPTNSWSTAAISLRSVMPTLWRGAVQTIPAAGHTPQWETPRGLRRAHRGVHRRDGVRRASHILA